MDEVRYVAPEKIRAFTVALLGKAGMWEADAGMVADNLIDADLRGVTTHGLTRIPLYFQKFEAGLCDPQGRPEVIRDFGATGLIHAHHCMGQVSSTLAMEMAIEKAEKFGVGYVGVRDGCHYGTAGYYAMMAERKGMIGLSITNSGAFVVPYGGAEKRLGTNPVAVAIPSKRHDPVLLDMATCRVARGKLIVAMKKGVPVPDDWALDSDGNPTTDAARGFAGMLLPLSYKGYGMALVIDLLAGVLNGSGYGTHVDLENDLPQVGSNFMAINTRVFCDPDEFAENVDRLIEETKDVRLAAGADRVYMPGEIEFDAERANRALGGVPLQAFQIRELTQMGRKYGLELESYLA